MLSSSSLYFVDIFAVTLLCLITYTYGQSGSIQTVVSSPEIGQSFTVQCEFTLPDVGDVGTLAPGVPAFVTVSLRGPGTDQEYISGTCIMQTGKTTYQENNNLPTEIQQRLSYSNTSSSLTLTVSNSVCNDEAKEYKCLLKYRRTSGGDTEKEDVKTISLKAPPSEPVAEGIIPPTNIEEGASMTAACRANTGLTGEGRIVWRMSVGATGVLEDTDQRVSSVKTSDSVNSCTESVVSSLTLNGIDKSFQGLTVSCFVLNNEYQPNPPAACTDADADLCYQTQPLNIYYPVGEPTITQTSQGDPYEKGSVTLTCSADGNPPPTYQWFKTGDANTSAIELDVGASLTINDLTIDDHAGLYDCDASNSYKSKNFSELSTSYNLQIAPSTTPPPTTTTPEPTTPDPTSPDTGNQKQPSSAGGNEGLIIGVCVALGVVLILLVVVFVIWRRRRGQKDTIEEPPEKPSSPRPVLSLQAPPKPDIVGDEKKFNSPSLNSSFQNEDGLMYADLTYDNRPRSRKPLAIGDTASEYSDVTMPQV